MTLETNWEEVLSLGEKQRLAIVGLQIFNAVVFRLDNMALSYNLNSSTIGRLG